MGETGINRFPGHLDPEAQEFRPRNPTIPFYTPPPPPPPQVYYPYNPPPYPQPNDVQVVPFCNGGVVYHPQFPSPSAYVSHTGATLPLPPLSGAATRALVLSLVVGDVSESVVRRELEVYGEVRGVQMERVRDGIVTVHFYDLRHAERALKEVREQHMQHQSSTRLRDHYNFGENLGGSVSSPARGLIAGRAVWAQFVIPANNAVPEGNNQGTLVVFNLDPGMSTNSLRKAFEAFGPVKEVRETPMKKHQRFIEFFDVRHAAKALREMNGKEIQGKQVVIEFSRPGGYSRKFLNAMSTNPTNIIPVVNSTNTYHTRPSHYQPTQPPPPPPPPLPRKLSGRMASNLPPRCLSQTQSSTKKLNCTRENPNGNSSNKSSIEDSMGSLTLDGAVGNGIEERESNGSSKRHAKKSNNYQFTGTTKQQQQQPRSRKGSKVKKFDTRFLINESAIVESNCRDSRTTVMIKNIPNKYSQKLLLNMLDNHCIHCNEQIADGDDLPLSSYDFLYLPIDFNNKCNVGYGFVNMTSPQATLRLYKAFHQQHWEVFNSRKICEVTYARVQGLEALKEHFKNSKFPSEMEHCLPVLFSPPREGRQLTEPLPIVGTKPIIIGDVSSPKADDDHEMDGQDCLEDSNDVSDADHQDDDDVLAAGSINSSSCSSTNGGDNGDDDKDSGSVWRKIIPL